jgi:mannose/fructose/N-acetylgalactosamine-specific phosphotransferase system component IID
MGGAAIVLGRAGFHHWAGPAIAALCALLLIRFRMSPIWIILVTAVVGLFLQS